MSDANEPLVSQGSGTDLRSEASAPEKAKDEAAAVTHTATEATKDVGRAVKDEATSVVDESKDQIRDLYEQTRSELAGEAAKQQERVATGLQTVGEDLDSMARNSEEAGLAREFVREASQRVNRVASWLSEREPRDVLGEVKTFARRQPGVFIGVAAIAGVVAGRLTRALASSAHDHQEGATAEETSAGGEHLDRRVPGSDAGSAGRAVPVTSEPPSPVGAHDPVVTVPGLAGGASADAVTRPEPGAAPDAMREEGSDERPYSL